MSIAEVVSEKGDHQNPRLLELQARAQEMAKYYFKGFIGNIDKILSGAELYLSRRDRLEVAQESYERLRQIDDFYATISFGLLEGKEEFEPLFGVKELLPKFREAMDRIFKDGKESGIEILDSLAQKIGGLARQYDAKMTEIIEAVRLFPEAKKFQIAVRDPRKNEIWHL